MNNREILYIEDNFHNRRIVRKILERQGYTLVECEDGLEGYEMLKKIKPSVVLLDISLPTMDGMEIAHLVKNDPELSSTYLLALTASAMQGDRERFLASGCDDYLSKPFRAQDLVDMVNRYSVLVGGESPAPSMHQAEMRLMNGMHAEEETQAPIRKVDVSVVSVDAAIAEVESHHEQETEPVQPTAPAAEDMAAEPAAEAPEWEIEAVGEIEVETPAVFEETPEVASAVEAVADGIPAIEDLPEMETPEPEPEASVGPEAFAVEVDVDGQLLEAFSEPADTGEQELPAAEVGEDLESVLAEEQPANDIDETVIETLADTAELSMEIEQDNPVWGLVTETLEIQETAEELEAAAQPVELTPVVEEPAKKSAKDSKSNGKPKREAKPTPSADPDLDLIKATIMGTINPDNLKPVDPNSF